MTASAMTRDSGNLHAAQATASLGGRRARPIRKRPEYRQFWRVGGFVFVPDRGVAVRQLDATSNSNASVLQLTPLEADFLTAMIRHSQQDGLLLPIVSRRQLIEELWAGAVIEFDNQIDKLVCKLRAKLGPRLLRVHRCRGIALRSRPVAAALTPTLAADLL